MATSYHTSDLLDSISLEYNSTFMTAKEYKELAGDEVKRPEMTEGDILVKFFDFFAYDFDPEVSALDVSQLLWQAACEDADVS